MVLCLALPLFAESDFDKLSEEIKKLELENVIKTFEANSKKQNIAAFNAAKEDIKKANDAGPDSGPDAGPDSQPTDDTGPDAQPGDDGPEVEDDDSDRGPTDDGPDGEEKPKELTEEEKKQKAEEEAKKKAEEEAAKKKLEMDIKHLKATMSNTVFYMDALKKSFTTAKSVKQDAQYARFYNILNFVNQHMYSVFMRADPIKDKLDAPTLQQVLDHLNFLIASGALMKSLLSDTWYEDADFEKSIKALKDQEKFAMAKELESLNETIKLHCYVLQMLGINFREKHGFRLTLDHMLTGFIIKASTFRSNMGEGSCETRDTLDELVKSAETFRNTNAIEFNSPRYKKFDDETWADVHKQNLWPKDPEPKKKEEKKEAPKEAEEKNDSTDKDNAPDK